LSTSVERFNFVEFQFFRVVIVITERERELLREQTGRGFSLVSTCFCMVSGVECRCAFMMAGSATNEN
jgi:hypothetical protein